MIIVLFWAAAFFIITMGSSLVRAESDVEGDAEDTVRIRYYKPIYFAYGNPITKIQYSFRIPMFDEIPLNFAYSQIIFWYFTKQPKPFLDATYNPEFFYRLKLLRQHLRVVDFGFFEHNSNGKSGLPDARSYDQTYIRFFYSYKLDPTLLQFSVKLRTLYNLDETNADIRNYIGPLEIEAKYSEVFRSILDKSNITVQISPGGRFADRWDLGGYQVSSTFHIVGLQFTPAFYIQYYHGYAESLLDYNKLVDVVRGGFRF
jgi:phospholipase A1/A2